MKRPTASKALPAKTFSVMLELRLDNIVFRANWGLAGPSPASSSATGMRSSTAACNDPLIVPGVGMWFAQGEDAEPYRCPPQPRYSGTPDSAMARSRRGRLQVTVREMPMREHMRCARAKLLIVELFSK